MLAAKCPSCGSTEPTRGHKSRSGRLIPTNAHPSPGRRKKPRPERQHIESPSAIRTGAPKAMIRRLTMAKLIYATPSSLDGYIVDETGNPDWAAPDEEGFAFITALIRPIGTYLYGRRMYKTMSIWETPDLIPGRTPAMLNFARIWQAADKIVYSRSLETVSTPKTRLAREFDPQAIRDLKALLPHDISLGGPTVA